MRCQQNLQVVIDLKTPNDNCSPLAFLIDVQCNNCGTINTIRKTFRDINNVPPVKNENIKPLIEKKVVKKKDNYIG